MSAEPASLRVPSTAPTASTDRASVAAASSEIEASSAPGPYKVRSVRPHPRHAIDSALAAQRPQRRAKRTNGLVICSSKKDGERVASTQAAHGCGVWPRSANERSEMY